MLMVLLMLTALSAAAFQLHPSPIHRAATPFSFLRQCGDDNARHHQVLARDHNRIIALSADNDEDTDESPTGRVVPTFEPPPEPPTTGGPNFFGLYGEDELADLWKIHNEFFGDTAAAEPEEDDDNAEVNIFGGLHAAVQQAIADGESNKPDASGEGDVDDKSTDAGKKRNLGGPQVEDGEASEA